MLKFSVAVVAATFAAPLFAYQESGRSVSQAPAAEKIVGSYSITEGAKNGEKIPAERIKDSTVAITPDTIAVVDRDQKKLYSAKYKLMPGGESGVWKIDMESQVPQEGTKALGLLKQDGEQLWLIYTPADERSLTNNKRPEGFDKTEEGQHLFKMKRHADAASLNTPTVRDE